MLVNFIGAGHQHSIAHNWSQVRANHAMLASLWAAADPDLLLINAHDPQLLRQAQGD